MNTLDVAGRLSQLATHWTVVGQAHQGPAEEMRAARELLLERYGGAARRYLLGALREVEAAEELFQEFALRFLRGDFRRADPRRGRFRSFLKTALFRLVVHYRRRRQRRPLPLREDAPQLVCRDDDTAPAEREFLCYWRQELLARAWQALQSESEMTGQPFYAVLRFRADNAALRSPEMAQRLASQLGRTLTAVGVRQMLHRARERFGEALLDEVAQSLDRPSPEQLEQELLELGLLEYCRSTLERRGSRRVAA
jgi:RNA polymerase sigma-70 factor (ECF subfamily)